jgi:hypothetical protein
LGNGEKGEEKDAHPAFQRLSPLRKENIEILEFLHIRLFMAGRSWEHTVSAPFRFPARGSHSE